MQLENVRIGFALTGSFCTFPKILPEISRLVEEGADVLPIMTPTSANTDTRFGTAREYIDQIEKLTGKKILTSITEAEPIGPKEMVDVMVIAPCTGNTLAKLANAITDNAVLMAVKSHLRNQKPVVIGLSSNDGLGMNAKNLGLLLNTKNIYFVPFKQDDPFKKPNSLVARYDLLIPTVLEALEGKQVQPLLAD